MPINHIKYVIINHFEPKLDIDPFIRPPICFLITSCFIWIISAFILRNIPVELVCKIRYSIELKSVH